MLATTRTGRMPSPIVWLSTEYNTLISWTCCPTDAGGARRWNSTNGYGSAAVTIIVLRHVSPGASSKPSATTCAVNS